jgi:hypothetical protein
MPSLSLEHPSASIFTQISEKKAEEKTLRDSVIAEIEHNIEKELPNIKDLSKQSQVDALANLLINEERKLLDQRYLDAASRGAYTKAVSNVILKNPDFTSVLAEALQKAFDISMEEINNEYIKLVESFKRLRENPSIAKMEEGRSVYYTETSPETPPGYSEPVPFVFKEYAFQEESLKKPAPLLLEPEQIQSGQLVPQAGSGIPIGGARRLIRRTIRRKPKRRRKYVRPRIRRQRRRTIRRRTTTRRRRTTTRRRRIRDKLIYNIITY